MTTYEECQCANAVARAMETRGVARRTEIRRPPSVPVSRPLLRSVTVPLAALVPETRSLSDREPPPLTVTPPTAW